MAVFEEIAIQTFRDMKLDLQLPLIFWFNFFMREVLEQINVLFFIW